MKTIFDQESLIKGTPNIRCEPKGAKVGYIWGKSVDESNILKLLGITDGEKLEILGIDPSGTVAELWIASDDREYPSQVVLSDGQSIDLPTLLQEHGREILGSEHYKQYGPYLMTIMKLLDTNNEATQGAHSIQVHPKEGHPLLPAKPEMWKGSGRAYIGWKKDVTPEEIQQAVQSSSLESLLNEVELTPEKPVIISGGLVHTMRSGTFACEWSLAPGADDSKKGNLKNATVSLYDRTDGKTPRIGKENVDEAIEVLEHADGLKQQTKFYSEPFVIFDDHSGNKITQIFRTSSVIVDEIEVQTKLDIDMEGRGFPLFVEQGDVLIQKGNKKLGELKQGEYCIVPACIENFIIVTENGAQAKVYKWYPPLNNK